VRWPRAQPEGGTPIRGGRPVYLRAWHIDARRLEW